MKHVDITVRGFVVGVGFRWATRKKAHSLGVNGFVKNNPDNSVYIEAEGGEKTLDEFVAWCKKGPVWAHVSTFHVRDAPLQHFKEFTIA